MQALYSRHKVRVYRYTLRLIGDAAAAEDITSEVFLEVWRHADTFKAKSRVSTWILGVARYKALSALRRRPKEPSMSARRTWSPIPPRIRRRWRRARSKE